MKNSEKLDIEICSDCAMMSANGLYGWEYDQKWLEAYETAYKEYGEPVLNCGDDCGTSFSWSSCDFCGSELGGDRHPAVIWYQP